MPESVYYGGNGTQIVSSEVSPSQFTSLLTRVQTLESSLSALSTTVGSSSSGLMKSVNDLASSVSGLQTVVGDSSTGLVKDVTDLQTTVGDNTAGLVKRVSDLEIAAETAAESSTAGEG